MSNRKRLVLTTLALGLLAGVAARSRADIVYSTGFEDPPFQPGAIVGQDGWQNVQGTPESKTIEDMFFHTGSQALLIDPSGQAPGTQDTLNHPSPFDTASGPQKVVTMASDVYIQSSATQTRWGFDGRDGTGAIIGGVNIRETDAVQIVTAGLPIVPGITFERDQWNRIEVRYDFAMKTFDTLINGSLIASDSPFFTNTGNSIFGAGIFGSSGPADDRAYLRQLFHHRQCPRAFDADPGRSRRADRLGCPAETSGPSAPASLTRMACSPGRWDPSGS